MSRTFTKYDPRGVLALHPEAFGAMYLCDPDERANIYHGDVAVVRVEGPLMAAPDSWFDSYAEIRARFAEACANEAVKRVVLYVDSPGGVCHDLFRTSRDLRAIAAASGREFIAYVDEGAFSACYALISGAQRIVVNETSGVGSVGCIKTRFDLTGMNERDGFKVALITSGSKKAYGNPDLAISDAELADAQAEVDTYAAMFFELVSAHRPALTVEKLKGFEAGTFVGAQAVQAGLADEVGTREDLLVVQSNIGDQVSIDEVMKALGALAAGDGEDKDKAARMLAAAEGEASEDAPTEDEPEASDAPAEDAPKEDEPEAEGSDEPAPDEDEDKEEDAPDAAAIAAMRAEIAALKAQIKPSKPVITTVAPRAKAPAPKSKLDRELDRAFGLDKSSKPSVTREGNAIVFR